MNTLKEIALSVGFGGGVQKVIIKIFKSPPQNHFEPMHSFAVAILTCNCAFFLFYFFNITILGESHLLKYNVMPRQRAFVQKHRANKR